MKMEAEIRGMCPHAEEGKLAANYQKLGSDTDPFLDLSGQCDPMHALVLDF